jgi:hypothetical protein
MFSFSRKKTNHSFAGFPTSLSPLFMMKANIFSKKEKKSRKVRLCL